MKTQQIAITDVRDFCTLAYAAQLAGVSIRTVNRAIGAGLLESRCPVLADHESRSFRGLLLLEDARRWAEARKAAGK